MPCGGCKGDVRHPARLFGGTRVKDGQKLTMQLFRFKSSLPGQHSLTNNQKSICVVGPWPEFGVRALACQCRRRRISVQNKLKLELQTRKGLPCKKWRQV